MSHTNAPLSIEGRHRLVERCKTRPIAHVAAELDTSRACASKWANRWRRHGEAGLCDRSSSPHRSPSATPAWVIEKIESRRLVTDALRLPGHLPEQELGERAANASASWSPTRTPSSTAQIATNPTS